MSLAARFSSNSFYRVVLLTAGLVAMTTLLSQAVLAGSKEETNKQVVLRYYKAGLQQYDFAAAAPYLGDHFIQHNPTSKDGALGLKAFIDFMHREHPNTRVEVVRAIAEGDFVVLHVHASLAPGDKISDQQDSTHLIEYAVVDIYRLENKKIVEHWDVIQEVPEKSANENGMFGPNAPHAGYAE
jgi:predicted SnoaL-like aldol condensation-catalyzing enzyme